MQLNPFQKILSLLFFFIFLLIFVFFVPFRDENTSRIIFDTIWSNHSKIDLYRCFLFLIILSVTYLFLFFLLNQKYNSSKDLNKIQLKKELFYLFIFLFINTSCFLYLIGYNYLSDLKKNHFIKNIEINSKEIEKLSNDTKFLNRKYLWLLFKEGGLMTRDYNNMDEFWNRHIINLKNPDFIVDISGYFNDMGWNKDNINTPEGLRKFILNNRLTASDYNKLNEINRLESNNLDKVKLISQLSWYDEKSIRNIVLYCIVISLTIVYGLRIMANFFMKIINELKNE
jgi:hypothetical protein